MRVTRFLCRFFRVPRPASRLLLRETAELPQQRVSLVRLPGASELFEQKWPIGIT